MPHSIGPIPHWHARNHIGLKVYVNDSLWCVATEVVAQATEGAFSHSASTARAQRQLLRCLPR